MGSVTAASLQTLLNVTDLVLINATCEAIIDQAINLLNLYGHLDLPNMGGTSGSKTVSLESREEGAVLDVAAAVYNNMYVLSGSESSSYGIGAISMSSTTSASTQAIKSAAREAARFLSEPEVDIG